MFIAAITKTFPYSHKNKTVTVQRKEFQLKLGHDIVVHNSKASSVEYMKKDFDRASKNGKPSTVPIDQGDMHTILSCAKKGNKLFRL